MSFIKYIADERSAQRDACPSKNHYKEVLSLVAKAKRTVWIGKFFASKATKRSSAARNVAVESIVQTQ